MRIIKVGISCTPGLKYNTKYGQHVVQLVYLSFGF